MGVKYSDNPVIKSDTPLTDENSLMKVIDDCLKEAILITLGKVDYLAAQWISRYCSHIPYLKNELRLANNHIEELKTKSKETEGLIKECYETIHQSKRWLTSYANMDFEKHNPLAVKINDAITKLNQYKDEG